MNTILIRHTNNQMVINTLMHRIVTGGSDLCKYGIYCESLKTHRELQIPHHSIGCSENPECHELPCIGCDVLGFLSEQPETFIGWDK